MIPKVLPSVSWQSAKLADPGDRRLRPHDLPAGLGDLRARLVDGRHVHGGRGPRRRPAVAARQAAVDPRLLVRAGLHHPALHRAGPLLERPPEDLTIEFCRAVGVGRRQIEVHHSGHAPFLLSRVFALGAPTTNISPWRRNGSVNETYLSLQWQPTNLCPLPPLGGSAGGRGRTPLRRRLPRRGPP